ncbi:MAG: ABC transporter ATP-binding protein [Pseudomonadota bacterium]
MSSLVLSGVSKSFGAVTAVEPTDLTFEEGKLTALLGPSGCGKTTLLRMLAGLEQPSRGSIMLGGEDITAKPAHARKFGMVFQNFALFPHYSVRQNVAYSLLIEGTPKAEAYERADVLLGTVQLEGFGDRRIGELSGGQRQRVAIARALAQEPQVFLLDEPMSALDAKLREDMQVELRLLQQRLGITTVVVTHDQREAMTMADTIVVMSNGRVEQVAAPQEIYHRPANAFVADFIGKANFFDGVYGKDSVTIGGRSFAVPPGFSRGSPVRCAIRPEAASLAPHGGPNCVDATVLFVRDLGPVKEYHLNSAIGPIIVECAASADDLGLKAGDGTFAQLPAEALRVYPREAAAA